MNSANPSENIDFNCRRLLGVAAMTVASAPLGIFSSANVETTQPTTTKEEELMTTVALHEAAIQSTDRPAIRSFPKVHVPEAELTELRRRNRCIGG